MFGARKNRRKIDQAAVRDAARSLAARGARLFAALALAAVVVAGAALGAAEGRRWLTTSPTFALDHIGFEGLSRARAAELLRLGGVRTGDNIFDVDPAAVEKGMAAHPWVRQVAVEKSYPRALGVRVVEHAPAALADLSGLYYVNDVGKAFKRLAPGEEADLPILTGLSRDDYITRQFEVEATFRDALDAVAEYRDAGLEKKAPLSEVRVDRQEGLTLFVGSGPTAVRLGFKEYREKLDRLDKLLSELSRRGARAEVIRLDNGARPGWVAVQLAKGGE